MVKRLVLVVFFLISSTCMFAQSLNGWGQDLNPDSNLSFWNNDMKLVLFGDPPIIFTTKYMESIINSIHYIDFSFPSGKQESLPTSFKDKNRWLIIYTDGFLFSYKNDFELPIGNGFIGKNQYRVIECNFTSSSSLIEDSTAYPASNLGLLALKKPWVEGVVGYGIGESITIISGNDKTYIKEILISIGFVSYDNPDLYEENSRPKIIELSTEDGKFKFNVTLKDTPMLQSIKLPIDVKSLKITIKEVYKGTKWDDTCINFIVPLM